MAPTVVSFGAGVNSTALLIGLKERGIRPDLIMFADTQAEMPGTYVHLEEMKKWVIEAGFPEITTVQYDTGPNPSLEKECHNNITLPSIVYGNRGCSVKWKRYPQGRYMKAWQPAIDTWERGEKIVQMIGIDAGETHRGKFPPDKKIDFHFPLIEWGWARDECVEAIEREGLEIPGKSACWFCPAMKKHEVLKLAAEHPDLLERAVKMEHIAAPNNKTVKGLGRNWSWENLVKADRAQLKLWPDTQETPCMCFDGEEE